LAAVADTVSVNLSDRGDNLLFTSGGIDVGRDGDEDVTVAGTELVEVDGRAGDDIINAAAYTGAPAGGVLDLRGGDGNDRLTGEGRNDHLYGGPGNDRMYGGAGNDWFHADSTADGADYMHGGGGVDNAYYHPRTVAINLTLGNGLADDGEPGEGDDIDLNVEDATGGAGDDVLVGSKLDNDISGGPGNDEIYGGSGDDLLDGHLGNDLVFGEDGDDSVHGWKGDDILTGGPGADEYAGNAGNDTILNADGFADRVFCGDDVDDVEEDPLDTFPLNDCEL
jgi:Ca2+-binding RTX toxin-like protein